MILLLGGTADTNTIATALIQYGYSVLVSTASNHPLTTPVHPQVKKVWGKLNLDTLSQLVTNAGVHTIIDASHPYTEIIGPLSRQVAATFDIPYYRYLRPASSIERSSIVSCATHETAAHSAFALKVPVLLTIGAKNIRPYVTEARRTKTPVVVRVLNRPESIANCHSLAIPSSRIIAKRGPFSIKDNISLISQFQIGALVTKDGGVKGGFPEKLQAAEQIGCKVFVVARPHLNNLPTFDSVTALVNSVKIRTQFPAEP